MPPLHRQSHLPLLLLLLLGALVAGALAVPARLRRHVDVALDIIGGNSVEIENFPYQVSMEKFGEHDCGGSIIGKQWVLTAAHCLWSTSSPKVIGVRYGSSTRQDGGTLLDAVFIGYHDKYEYGAHHHDVALIQVAGDIAFSGAAQPVRMVDVGAVPDAGAVLTVSGWGLLDEDDWEGPMELYAVQVPYVPRAVCKISYAHRGKKVDDTMLCAGVAGKDSCLGDSGGPLVNDLGIQVGVVSWAIGCASEGFPGVYADLANDEIRQWIKATSGIA